MLILYHGHSEFCLERTDGFTALTDPYDAHVGYPMEKTRADVVTVSHGHGDHSDVAKVLGSPAILDSEGLWLPAPDVRVTAIPSFHDEAQGTKRGGNLLMKIEMEGLTIVHLGDLGVELTPAQVQALGRVDVLLAPVGGYYTIDARAARSVVSALRPRIVIPMHYKTAANADWPIADEKEFLRLMGAEGTEALPLLRVTKGDLSQQPPVVLLRPSEA